VVVWSLTSVGLALNLSGGAESLDAGFWCMLAGVLVVVAGTVVAVVTSRAKAQEPDTTPV
jgi:hypothetical protein